MRDNRIKNPKCYDGILWAIVSFIALMFHQSRMFSPIVAVMSIVMCFVYLKKHDSKIALQIIALVISSFSILLFVWYIFNKVI